MYVCVCVCMYVHYFTADTILISESHTVPPPQSSISAACSRVFSVTFLYSCTQIPQHKLSSTLKYPLQCLHLVSNRHFTDLDTTPEN
jgi:hypothetical protein